MTIGIGAAGPRAGLAVFRGLQAAERVGAGSIGGFATFVAITADGDVLRSETNRGGSRTLFCAGEETGVAPPDAVVQAPVAGVISSGPDRREPLARFVAADGAVGFVTGHRSPNDVGAGGKPHNDEALARMIAGASARDAVAATLGENAEADVGLIAVDRQGTVFAANSERVGRRPDLGHARREAADIGAVVEVLLNSIRPHASLAPLVAEIALDTMVGEPSPLGSITVAAGVPIVPGDADTVLVDDAGQATQIVTTDTSMVSGRHDCTALYLHCAVRRGGRLLGHTLFEANGVVGNGRIISLNGKEKIDVSYG